MLHYGPFSLLLVLILSGYPQSSSASLPTQEPAPAQSTTAPEEKPSRWQWSFTIGNRTGFRLNEPRVFQMSRTFVDVKGIYKMNDEWRLTAEGRAHYDPVERLGYPNRPWFDPRQFLLDGKIKSVSLSLGLQQVVWGQADGLRVLDIINPLDYREFILEDFLDSRRPLWTARADVPVGGGSLQLLWIPYFAPGRVPAPENEFGLGPSFGLSLIAEAFGDLPIADFALDVKPARRPAYRLRSSQAGARYSRSVARWDVTANYFYGWEDVATPYLGGFDETTFALTIAPRYDRKVVYGGTAATNFGPVVLRMEAGWNARRSVAVTTFPPITGFERFGQFSSVVGADYSFRPWLWLSGQYFLQVTSAPQQKLVFPRYNHLASFYARGDFFRETFKPELFILTGLNQRQYMIRPRVTRSFGDHWSVSIGADFLGGRSITPFGFFATRDRLVLELKWLK
ncbi:MAG: hypothetical protein HY314_17490 [Acidobacteria bacterium]|nr:hypothetical protein [Acidobacteriota bacterium]